MDATDFPVTQTYSSACFRCRYVIPSLSEVSSPYFSNGYVTCSNCGTAVDMWEAILERVIRLPDFRFSLAALGPRVTHLKFRLLANQTVELDLTQYGVSDGATILAVNYTPQCGNCLPLEAHGNSPTRRYRGTKVNLYGVQTKTSDGIPIEDEFSGDNIGAMVLWAPAEDSAMPWRYLVDAIEAVAWGHFAQAIVPAHAAAEISITPVVRSFLIKYSAKKNVERLLKQEAGFSSILNVVLPLVCALAGAKPLHDVIRGTLNELRDLRNDFVHEGVLPIVIDPQRIRRLLCAAAFGLEYGKYLRTFL